MVGIRAGVVRGMTRGVMGCDYSHTGSYFLLLTHRRCSPCLVIHTGEVLSPFSGIQDWISLSQALFAGALWLPSGCVVATPLFMGSRYHTALSCLLLNTYYSHTGMGGRAGRRQGQSVGTGQQQGPAGGSVETFRSKRFSRMTTLCSVQCLL